MSDDDSLHRKKERAIGDWDPRKRVCKKHGVAELWSHQSDQTFCLEGGVNTGKYSRSACRVWRSRKAWNVADAGFDPDEE